MAGHQENEQRIISILILVLTLFTIKFLEGVMNNDMVEKSTMFLFLTVVVYISLNTTMFVDMILREINPDSTERENIILPKLVNYLNWIQYILFIVVATIFVFLASLVLVEYFAKTGYIVEENSYKQYIPYAVTVIFMTINAILGIISHKSAVRSKNIQLRLSPRRVVNISTTPRDSDIFTVYLYNDSARRINGKLIVEFPTNVKYRAKILSPKEYKGKTNGGEGKYSEEFSLNATQVLQVNFSLKAEELDTTEEEKLLHSKGIIRVKVDLDDFEPIVQTVDAEINYG